MNSQAVYCHITTRTDGVSDGSASTSTGRIGSGSRRTGSELPSRGHIFIAARLPRGPLPERTTPRPDVSSGIDRELQQALLDELAAKLRSQAKTVRPVRNPIGPLTWICQEAKAGRRSNRC